MGIEAIVFDLDGTLIDSVPDVRAALNRILAEEGRRPLALDEVKSMIGHGATVTIEKALEATGPAGAAEYVADFLERYLDTYRQRPTEHTVVYPGVLKALEHFTGGVAMGICTNKPRATTLPVLEALELDRFFSAVTCGDSVPHPKPDGRHVLLTLEMMNADPTAAALVGDSESDISAALDAGIPAVCVTYGYSHVPVESLGADAIIESFHDLVDALRQISNRTFP